jgi:putative polyketide hydroxylase
MVSFRAPLWDVIGPHRYGIYAVTHPDAVGSFLPAGPSDRWLFGRSTNSAEGGNLLTADKAVRLIRTAAGVARLPVDIERIGLFQSAAQVAERFRAGDIFLVGDAAHRVTPRGGTGMNTALHGGYDVGWKLAWVLRGWAAASLLDTYELERRPVAEHNVARSANPEGTRRSASSELRADVGGRIAHHWLPGEDDTSTLDLIGPGLTLFTGPDPSTWRTAAARVLETVPVVVRSVDVLTARALGVPLAGALLVRPDGAPAGLLASHAASGLRSAVRSVTAPSAVPISEAQSTREVA